MWTGIYGKYPDRAYLTDEDKRMLMRSPFFYHPNDTPVFELGKVITSYKYPGGAFEQRALERRLFIGRNPRRAATRATRLKKPDATPDTLSSATGRGFTIRLPIAGGRSFLSTDGEKTWRNLYEVSP